MDLNEVLALYDCRSKQEYIYRTNRVQEITGGSELLRDLFSGFFSSEKCRFKINFNWDEDPAPDYLEYFRNSGYDGETVYEGGGNLCMIFRDENTYLEVNKALSIYVLEETYTVSIIASHVIIEEHDGKYDFVEDRRKLYQENILKKNLGAYYSPCNVLPFTQIDRLTYQPIVKKESKGEKDERMYTAESLKKQEKYKSLPKDDFDIIIEHEFDDMVNKGKESLLAIIYIDGNNMGEKLKRKTDGLTSYSEGIKALRDFSRQTNRDFVQNPISAIKECLSEKHKQFEEKHKDDDSYDKEYFNPYLCRFIITGGDEINLVCNARAVPVILEKYFGTLSKNSGNTACAGVAIFHSHAPFADVYEIAEQCCENAKKKAHNDDQADKNCIDFHYCHSGITNSLKEIRESQEAEYTCRPYEYSGSWQKFLTLGKTIASGKEIKVKRSDIKALSEAATKGDSYYIAELKRIDSRQNENAHESFRNIIVDNKDAKKMLYDLSIIYDLWFRKEEE